MNLRCTPFLIAAFLNVAGLAQIDPAPGVKDPHKDPDGTWVGVAGKVKSTSPGSFILDYGKGSIQVELEPAATKKHAFIDGEQVTVYGVVDEGFFKGKTIRAHAVYVESLQTYACTTDGAETICASLAPVVYSGVIVFGRVTAVTPGSLQVDDGDRLITIDTGALNRAGNTGDAEPVQVGDLVTVLGIMDDGLFARRLKASSVTVERSTR